MNEEGFKVLGYERETVVSSTKGNRSEETLRSSHESSPISITLERIDTAIIKHLVNQIKPKVTDNGKQVIVPVEYANAERWKQVRKDGVLRDGAGRIQTPIILVHRTSIRRNNTLTNPVNKYIDRSFQTGWNQHNSYDKFAVLNRIIPSRKIVSVKQPDYVDLTYDFLVWTDYIEQMNALLEQLNFEMDNYWGSRGDFKFKVYTEDYSTETETPTEGDRVVKSTFQAKVNAYLLPETMIDIDRGVQATDQLRYTPKKVVMFSEIDRTGIRGEAIVIEKWPAGGTDGGSNL